GRAQGLWEARSQLSVGFRPLPQTTPLYPCFPTCSLFLSHTVLVFGVLVGWKLGAAPVSYAFTPSYQVIM
ncbi:hypothetical protein, partial [Acetobacter indonesiensis]|uniref:hypothetical protein n=1 Tax=Acetobacter indonesiensis TaxID=104101 RepID=UPI0039BFD27E